MDRETWYAMIHGVAKSWTRLSDWTELMVRTGASQVTLVVENPPANNTGDIRDGGGVSGGLDPWTGRSRRRGHGNPLHYSCLENPMNCSPPGSSLPMRFSKQGYWSGLPCPPLGDLPNPRIKHTSVMSPVLADRFFTTSATWEAHIKIYLYIYIYKSAD